MTQQLERLREALADRYRIERELGAGGMATVYLAQDLKHDRLVAVKVLKPELAAVLGAERFVVEIKTTASMSHPHILPLFDSGSADGFLFYVMPYIEGETLRDRLNRETQLGIDDAVRIAREVLDALEYAHSRGVIHRDIKPENILMQGSRPMIADFGIALAVSAAAGGRMTETGLSLGTPHYMSPEQATAEKEITGRADIYSLASVLYEMLTGEPPHMGNSAQQIIMKIITEPAAAVTKFRKSVPPNVAAAVAKALEKLPADRFGSAQAFADALGNPTFALSTTAMTASGFTSTQPRRAFAAAFPWLLVVGALAFAAYSQLSRPSIPIPPIMRFSLQWEGKGRFVDGSGSPIAFSPDGQRIVYLGVDDDGVQWLYARALGRVEPMQIAGTRGAIAPIVSPDGAHVGFIQDGMIRTVMLDGGSTVTVAEANTNSMAWGNDGFIYYTSGEKLLRVTATGGSPEVVLSADSARGEALRWPDPLPDGRSVLLTLVRDGAPVLAVGSISDGTVTELGRGGMYPRYVDGGHLVFLQLDGTLFGVSFDMRRARITGTPVPIADDVRFGPAYPAKMGISRTGSLAYAGGEAARREVVITDRRGVATVMPEDDRLYTVPRFSPDGRRLALTTLEFSVRTTSDLWSVEIANGNASRLTFDSLSRYGVWTRDGERLVVIRGDSLFQMPADGSGEAQLLLVSPQSISQVELFPDGRNVALVASGAGGDISTASLDSPQVVRPLVRTAFSERGVAISPDGQWIAYVSNETQVDEVYVRRAREGGGKWKVTRGGGREPRWGADGRELLYRKADTVLAVTVRPGAEPQFGDPLPLFVGSFNSSFNQPSWDVSRDGQRFAFTRSRNQNERLDMHVIVHWFENLSPQQRRAAQK